jgi:Flp pilus assembly protein TadD
MAIKLDSMNYKGYAGKGAAYMMILNSQDAARNYLRAIELNPEDVVSMSSLSVILFSDED